MLTLHRTDSTNPDFIQLVNLLDADLRIRDGEDHTFFAQFNKIAAIRHVVVAYFDGVPVGCGAVKAYTEEVGEIKRMYVRPEYRKQGIAGNILKELENWAAELNFKEVILETGQAQPEAIGLYSKSGYQIIPNYGQYAHVASSVCFRKAMNLG
ncbi:GNAT family N-acetyltransferase [Adhaeribacter rhizoryzae]|uniref:GNAT family N-acetyltransferase n=1 Tax=Adhaeribacter rhizoryzae TaxID=2607907 RepID=A0A5M6DNI4_9BACT|nr:GNAT family N-acetyltransferase [Adhaeribacter rhizoryzae]KAA5549088.1 GNAT family N-acetyltransferase [Adhaeribacter rhizoryzae]